MEHDIRRHREKLSDGRSVSFFLNVTTGLLVVDVEEDGGFGNEIVRRKLPDPLSEEDKSALLAQVEEENGE